MKDIILRETIKAQPADVYAALTKKEILEIWTGEPAEMETIPGSEFTWFGGDICGHNLAFEENKLLSQLWYFGENEPAKVTMLFYTDKKGCRIEVKMEGIPEEDVENLTEGWNDTIFASLKDLLEE